MDRQKDNPQARNGERKVIPDKKEKHEEISFSENHLFNKGFFLEIFHANRRKVFFEKSFTQIDIIEIIRSAYEDDVTDLTDSNTNIMFTVKRYFKYNLKSKDNLRLLYTKLRYKDTKNILYSDHLVTCTSIHRMALHLSFYSVFFNSLRMMALKSGLLLGNLSPDLKSGKYMFWIRSPYRTKLVQSTAM